jgi:NADPH2:quinone reductase
MKAVRVHSYGGPEVLRLVKLPIPEPGPGEIRIRTEIVGVNYVDIYHRSGQMELPLPFTPGMDATGVVDAVGLGVTEVSVGNRVAYAEKPGAYAEYVVIPTRLAVTVPDRLDSRVATAAMLQGLTAHYLAHDVYSVANGDMVVVHAAAGGVGQLLVQFAKRAGAMVIGTVSSDEKAAVAVEIGVDHVVRYDQEDLASVVRKVTNGAGVHCVYDSVGCTTFFASLDSLRPRGTLVLFGRASGPAPLIDPFLLAQRGSIKLTWPTLTDHLTTRDELLARAADVFSSVLAGTLRVRIDKEFPFDQVAQSHRYLETRRSMGKVVLRHER